MRPIHDLEIFKCFSYMIRVRNMVIDKKNFIDNTNDIGEGFREVRLLTEVLGFLLFLVTSFDSDARCGNEAVQSIAMLALLLSTIGHVTLREEQPKTSQEYSE